MFVDGEQQILARYPNCDANQVLQGSTSQADIKARSEKWSNPAGGYIRALHSNRWGGNSYKITGKNDSALGLSYEWVGDNNRGSGMLSSAIMVENIFEELDSPGEWYYDGEEGKLYIWPQKGTDLNKASVEGAVTEELLHVEGKEDGEQVTNLAFSGLTLENTKRTMFTGKYVPLMRSDWCVVRSGALFIQDAEDVVFENGTIRNIGGNAVFLSGHSKGVKIDNNEIINIGSSGVLAAGFPDSCREASFWNYTAPLEPETDEKYVHKTTIDDKTPGPKAEHYPREAVISNNHIQNVGIWEKQSSHVALSVAYEIQIVHNTLHEGPRAGVNVGDGTFGGHEIAYNDIFDVQKETDDHGMFNSWGRDRFWSLGGYDTGGNNGAAKEPYSELDVIDTITIHDNRMHFAGRVDGGSTFGIDLDDGSTNYEIYNNLCLNMGIKLREGFHRNVYNNILVNGAFNLHCTFEDSQDIIERNIVIMGTPYKLAATNEGRFRVSEDTIDNNWFYDFGMKTAYPGSWWQNLGFDVNSVNADPMFQDPEQNDYTVTNKEAMAAVGFENFPMDQFGKPGCEYQAPVYVKTGPDGSEDILERETWLGATISALDDAIMSSTGAGGLDGVYMESVPEDSQASLFGFETGDVLKSINGQTIGEKSNFIPLYEKIENDCVVNIVIVRNQLTEELNFIKNERGTIIDDQGGTVQYHGSHWEKSSPSNNPTNAEECIGKTMSYCNVGRWGHDGVYAEVPFKGTQIEMFSRTENNMGKYKITIKDASGQTVQEGECSAYSEQKTNQVSIFKSEVFPSGEYTLTVSALDGDYLIIDAFKVYSSEDTADQTVVKPISVSSEGVRTSELVSERKLHITVPVVNNGESEVNVAVAAVLSGGIGVLQTEKSISSNAQIKPGEETKLNLEVDTPEGSESKRLEIFVYNAASGKMYAYPFTVDGASINPYTAPISDAAGEEIQYTYTAEQRLLTSAAKGFAHGVQAMSIIQSENGDLLGIRQETVGENGQVKCAFILPEGTEGDITFRIYDEMGTEKELSAEISSEESVLNKDALQAAVEAAAAIISDDAQKELYTRDSWMTFYNAYYAAMKQLEDTALTQADIIAVTDALTGAQMALTSLNIEEKYNPSSANKGVKFEIYKDNGEVDGGNTDSKNGDQWQARDSQVDTTFKGAYAEFKGNFVSFAIDGANKYDSADFKVVITDGDSGEEVCSDEVKQTRDQGGNTVRIYEKTGLSGNSVTIRVYHNDNVDKRYLELRGITCTVRNGEMAPELQKIEITKQPDIVEYEKGFAGEISLLGGELTETYSDGSENVIPMNSNMYAGGFDTSETGEKKIIVSHGNLEAEFTVKVTEPVVTSYKLTVENGTGSGEYVAGETVKIKAEPAPEGMEFSGWVSNGGGLFLDATAAETTFTMPEGDTVIIAQYKAIEDEDNPNQGGSDTDDPSKEPSQQPGENIPDDSHGGNGNKGQNGSSDSTGESMEKGTGANGSEKLTDRNSGAVQTGDTTPAVAAGIVVMLSATAAVAAVVMRKKNR